MVGSPTNSIQLLLDVRRTASISALFWGAVSETKVFFGRWGLWIVAHYQLKHLIVIAPLIHPSSLEPSLNFRFTMEKIRLVVCHFLLLIIVW